MYGNSSEEDLLRSKALKVAKQLNQLKEEATIQMTMKNIEAISQGMKVIKSKKIIVLDLSMMIIKIKTILWHPVAETDQET